LDKIDFLLYDEVHTAAAKESAYVLSKIRNARMFGFSATVECRFDGADLKTESLFGPVIFKRSYKESVSTGDIANIKTLLVNVDGDPTTYGSRSHITRRRKSYWNNMGRNYTIAKVASCFPEDWQVMIMCETAEHVFRLGKMLPEYTLVYSSISKAVKKRLFSDKLLQGHPPMTPDRMVMLQRMFESQKIKKVICTNTWGTGVNFTGLRVVIRADGSTGDIKNTQIPGRLSRLSDGKSYGILVDFVDRFDVWAERRSKGRISVYRKHNWDLVVGSQAQVSKVIQDSIVPEGTGEITMET